MGLLVCGCGSSAANWKQQKKRWVRRKRWRLETRQSPQGRTLVSAFQLHEKHKTKALGSKSEGNTSASWRTRVKARCLSFQPPVGQWKAVALFPLVFR